MPRGTENYPTWDQVEDALRRQHSGTDNPGFCLACGEEAEGCEPDARRYECEFCGEKMVLRVAEVLREAVHAAHDRGRAAEDAAGGAAEGEDMTPLLGLICAVIWIIAHNSKGEM